MGSTSLRLGDASPWSALPFGGLPSLAFEDRVWDDQCRHDDCRLSPLPRVAEADAQDSTLGEGVMTSSLAARLQDIPGVDSVAVDLTDSGGGINVRLEPGADETLVMEKLRSLLVAYGVRSPSPPQLRPPRSETYPSDNDLGVDVVITPISGGARVEVAATNVRSFRVVAATPSAIAQGLADAWCQVIGRIPVEVVDVGVGDDGTLTVLMSNGVIQSKGSASVDAGWEDALTRAVGSALRSSLADAAESKMAVNT